MCNRFKSNWKWRYLVTIWLPFIDMMTDILTIVNYMQSDSTELHMFGIVLCAVLYLSIRMQAVFLLCFIINGEDISLVDDMTIFHVIILYIPFVSSLVLCEGDMPMALLCALFIEPLLLLLIIIYPFYHLCIVSNVFLHMIGVRHYGGTLEVWHQYSVERANQKCGYYVLSEFGFLKFCSQWEAVYESLPQIVIQIYVYCEYVQSVALWIFILSTVVSGLNIIRIIIQILVTGAVRFHYDEPIDWASDKYIYNAHNETMMTVGNKLGKSESVGLWEYTEVLNKPSEHKEYDLNNACVSVQSYKEEFVYTGQIKYVMQNAQNL